MKKEFMLYVRNNADAKKMLSADEHLAFVKKCEVYITRLKANGNLIAAQPLVREGVVIYKKDNHWQIDQLPGSESEQVGYYHLYANDLDDAIALAKDNPEFEYVPSAHVEIHPVKTKEEETGFEYPK